MRQIRKSDLFLESRIVRFGDGAPKRAVVLNFKAIREVCDVDGFINSHIDALQPCNL